MGSLGDGALRIRPEGGPGYSLPNLFTSISPSWAPPATVEVGNKGVYSGGTWYSVANHLDDPDGFDAAVAFARVRVTNPHYWFYVRKEEPGAGAVYRVESVRFECVVEDLYDFNYECNEPALQAAGIQIGYGSGNNGRLNGVIYRDRIIIDHSYPYPFEHVNSPGTP